MTHADKRYAISPRDLPGGRNLFSICLGLAIAQVLGTFQVYLSNQHLLASLTIVRQMGHVTVPNQWISAGLSSWTPALAGGIFFTLSIGAGLTVATMAAAAVWSDGLSRSRVAAYCGLLGWGLLLLATNSGGWAPLATAYVLLIPPAVFWGMTVKRSISGPKTARRLVLHTVPFALLVALWSWNADATLFTDIRDRILLINTFGRWFNESYYRYTLYAAEVIKPLGQKQIKTVDLGRIDQPDLRNSLEQLLCHKDYFITPDNSGGDIHLSTRNGHLLFKYRGRTVIKIPIAGFEGRAETVVSDLEQACDRYALFRILIMGGVLVGFPLLLYLILHMGLCILMGLAYPAARKWIPSLATGLCFVAGLLLLTAFHSGRVNVTGIDLGAALASSRWQVRVAALRTIYDRRLEIGRFPAYHQVLQSPHIAERYWLAKTFAASRQADTYPALLRLLDDPQVNVVTMAYYALGHRGDQRTIAQILNRIAVSRHWYVQWYAYKALFKLGWQPHYCPEPPA